METLNHLALEREIVAELVPSTITTNKDRPVTVRRETVLAVLSRSAQTTTGFCDLLNEAGLLAASALEMDYFGHAQVQRAGLLTFGWGSVLDSNHNIDPVPIEIIWDSSCSGFGYAIEAGHPILLGAATEETRFRDPQLISQNVQSGAICPIVYREQQYGAIGVFNTHRRVLTKDEVLFLQSVALLLGPTRAHQKTERALTEHSRFLSTAIDSLDAIVVLLDANGAVLQINRACQDWGGISADQLRGRKLWNTFFLPGEESAIRALIQDVGKGTGQQKCDTFFLPKQGDRRRVRWTVARLTQVTGEATFLATGIDITDQYSAMLKLEEMEMNTTDATANQQPANTETDEGSSQRESEAAGRDRRRHDRRPYCCVQSIAPCLKGDLPARRDFREVRCHDISPRGFSFLLDILPDFEELVVAFGSAQSQLFLRARVKHTSQLRIEGQKVLKVGCEYLGRVRLPWVAENAKAS
jgi:PAS domain S-box-containing protein